MKSSTEIEKEERKKRDCGNLRMQQHKKHDQ